MSIGVGKTCPDSHLHFMIFREQKESWTCTHSVDTVIADPRTGMSPAPGTSPAVPSFSSTLDGDEGWNFSSFVSSKRPSPGNQGETTLYDPTLLLSWEEVTTLPPAVLGRFFRKRTVVPFWWE